MNLREGSYRLKVVAIAPSLHSRDLTTVTFVVEERYAEDGPEHGHNPYDEVEVTYNADGMNRLLRQGFGLDTPFSLNVVDNLLGKVVEVTSYVGTIKEGPNVGGALIKHKWDMGSQDNQ